MGQKGQSKGDKGNSRKKQDAAAIRPTPLRDEKGTLVEESAEEATSRDRANLARVLTVVPELSPASLAILSESVKAHLRMVTEHHMKKAPGMLYGLEFPWTGPMLEDFGPSWLTEAFHRAGSLEKSNRVTQVRVENIKVTAGNNAGKFLFNVRYANERAGLHTKLFAKVPFQMTKETKQDRLSSSVLKQPMDFFEINTYRLAETTLPVPTPKFYYGDISNLTSNFILITERVPFVEMDGRKRSRKLKPFEVEGPYDKCKDYQLRGSAKEYYSKIMEVSGQIAGADKSGRMGSQEFLAQSYSTPRARLGDPQAWGVTPHAASGGPPQANLAKLNTAIQFFSDTAKVVFPSYASDPAFVQKFTKTMMTFTGYFNELEFWKHQDPAYVALSHANLNVDNAYFWRDEAATLHCGVLDWGGFGAGCLGHKIWWYLNCSEWQPIQDHLGHYVDTFISAYRDAGGPELDRDRLLHMVKLTSLGNLYFMVSAVPDCLRQCPAKEWATIKDRRDPRIDENIGGKSTL
ncbi:CPK2, partial [Symbiodinium natans]